MNNNNTIILILLSCIIIYFIVEKCKHNKLEKAKCELFTIQNQNKKLENEYSKLYQKINNNKYQSVSLDNIKIPVKDDKYKTHGTLNKYEEQLLKERQKSRQLTTRYANQFCKNMVNNQKENKNQEDTPKLSEEELREIENRIFTRNVNKIHHKLHHLKHLKHSHSSSNHIKPAIQKSDLEKKEFNELLKKYNRIKRGRNKKI